MATRRAVAPDRRAHPAGVAGRQREHVLLAAFDVLREPQALLAEWAELLGGARGTGGGCEVAIGVGPSLFDDRFGLRDSRPSRLGPLPAFPGDELDPARSGGDVLAIASADAPAVAAAAVEALAGVAGGAVEPRWTQAGFLRPGRGTRRNPLGFKDGSMNPRRPWDRDRFVWVRAGDRTWMAGGTYLVYRRIHLDLDAWRALPVAEQERVIGRHKVSGAPLGRRSEFDPRRLEELPPGSHVVNSAARTNRGAAMLRRAYSYADGPGDAGLVFLAYQQDPRRQFVTVQRRLAAADALNAFATHTASAVVALPPPGGLAALARA
jgi:deferrochelatase/peroxidase EfeB